MILDGRSELFRKSLTPLSRLINLIVTPLQRNQYFFLEMSHLPSKIITFSCFHEIHSTKASKSNDFRWEVITFQKIGDECITVLKGHCHTSAAKSILFCFRTFFITKSIDFGKYIPSFWNLNQNQFSLHLSKKQTPPCYNHYFQKHLESQSEIQQKKYGLYQMHLKKQKTMMIVLWRCCIFKKLVTNVSQI